MPATAPAHIKGYSLQRLYVAPYDPDNAYSDEDLIRVPGIQECQVTLSNDAAELRGDNRVIAVVDQGNGGEFSLSEGGIDLAAAQVMVGGTVIEEVLGTDPDDYEVRTLRVGSADPRPYFVLVGVQHDDGAGGALQVVLWKAKLTGNVELQFSDQEFLTPSLSGTYLGRDADDVMLDVQQFATRVDPGDTGEGIHEPTAP